MTAAASFDLAPPGAIWYFISYNRLSGGSLAGRVF
jgi:hypothetical protein